MSGTVSDAATVTVASFSPALWQHRESRGECLNESKRQTKPPRVISLAPAMLGEGTTVSTFAVDGSEEPRQFPKLADAPAIIQHRSNSSAATKVASFVVGCSDPEKAERDAAVSSYCSTADTDDDNDELPRYVDPAGGLFKSPHIPWQTASVDPPRCPVPSVNPPRPFVLQLEHALTRETAVANVVRLEDATASEQFNNASVPLPSVGSAGHMFGTCRPCAFLYKVGCRGGKACVFCHLCPPEEKRRRRQERKEMHAAKRCERQLGLHVVGGRETWGPCKYQQGCDGWVFPPLIETKSTDSVYA